MNELFDTEPFKTPAKKHAGAGQVCGLCANIVRPHYYRDDWIYCKETPCKKTQFGIKKVRARLPACEKFKEAE